MLYKIIRGILMVVCFVLFRMEFVNRDRLDDIAGKIVCANHTSNWDPVFMALAAPKPMRFMGKKELFKIPILSPIFLALGAFPVDRGNNDIGAIKTAMTILKNRGALMIFPEGTRNRSNEIIAKAGVVTIAVHTDSKIMPVFISSPVRLFHKVRIVVGEEIYYSKREYGKSGYEECKEISENIIRYIKELSVDEHKHYPC